MLIKQNFKGLNQGSERGCKGICADKDAPLTIDFYVNRMKSKNANIYFSFVFSQVRQNMSTFFCLPKSVKIAHGNL